MKLIRNLGISLVAGATALTAMTAGAAAQSLQDVLNAARAEAAAVREANADREARFIAERNTQQQKLAQIRSQVNAESAESARLDAAFKANLAEIQRLQAELQEKQGAFAELFGAARSAASELKAQIDGSIISAQYPGRTALLDEIATSETLPSADSLRELYFTMMQEMTAQADVATFTANVNRADGQAESREVTRIGPFVAFSSGDYLVYKNNSLEFLPRQPAGGATDAARKVENYSGDGFVRGVIDPSLGTLLSLVVQTKTPMEVFNDGGPVGNLIAIMFVVGMVIGVFKLLSLWGTGSAVRGQMRKKTAGKGNPLGRIMQAYQSNTSADVETLALKLDDAVLKEVPKLESGLNLVKVIAAVAPLLGLLGTVIGMIQTFQAITLFGTGDPQLMADGISVALVTTMLGLIAAIPLLLVHSFASGAAKSVTQILEEQSAGMIAEHAESRG
jgi:biopolymer transport protein ExbB